MNVTVRAAANIVQRLLHYALAPTPRACAILLDWMLFPAWAGIKRVFYWICSPALLVRIRLQRFRRGHPTHEGWGLCALG